MADHSFDIASTIDMAEVTNAVAQTTKEISQRYDLKDDQCEVVLRSSDHQIVLHAPDEFKVGAIADILKQKLAKRSISLKSLSFGGIQSALGGRAKQDIGIQQGISSEQAKQIVKDIKDMKTKVQAQIQGDQVRVSAKSIDDLQLLIQMVRDRDYGFHVSCQNFR